MKCREASDDSEDGVVFRLNPKRKTTITASRYRARASRPAARISSSASFFLTAQPSPPQLRRGVLIGCFATSGWLSRLILFSTARSFCLTSSGDLTVDRLSRASFLRHRCRHDADSQRGDSETSISTGKPRGETDEPDRPANCHSWGLLCQVGLFCSCLTIKGGWSS